MQTSRKHRTANIVYKTFGSQWVTELSARIKSSYNLTGKCFEMPNVSYT